jgi:hypothetical protein
MVVVMTTNLLMKAEAVLLVAMQEMQVAEAAVVMAKMQVEVQK